LGELYLKARLGWREIDLNQHESGTEEWSNQEDDTLRKVDARVARLAKFQRGGNSGDA
jgi:hypothetical protein